MRNLSLMVPIPIVLRPNLSKTYTIPSTLSSKSSRKSLLNIMWQVAPMLSNQVFLQDANEVLNKTLFVPSLQCETMK